MLLCVWWANTFTWFVSWVGYQGNPLDGEPDLVILEQQDQKFLACLCIQSFRKRQGELDCLLWLQALAGELLELG